MDREISRKEIIKGRNRNYVKIGGIALAAGLILWFVTSRLTSSISPDEIHVSEISMGPMEISMSATGKVVPYFERVIVSPIRSQVIEIVRFPGDSVKKGDVILRLDLTSIRNEYQKMQDERLIKQSKLKQAQVSAHTQKSDRDLQLQIEALRLEKIAADLRNELYLDSIRATTKEQVNSLRLQNETVQLEYRRLLQASVNQEATSQADLDVLEIEYDIHKRSLQETARKLEDSEVRSPADAIVTWVKDEIGSVVAEGTDLVKLADLSRFKVEGEIADVYADKLQNGSEVIVKTGSLKLSGMISNIRPSVKNGQIVFNIELSESNHPKLRAGLKTDVYVINSFKNNALRISNGSYYSGKGEYNLWVVNGKEAVSRRVILGESNFEYVEVLEGLNAGERVIISNMEAFKKQDKLKIK